ncbi:MAG: phosphopantothenoylcysteine decarboxylase, partial [Bacteroidales bacterium]|nr:phosphopantothenoylcysteine decarboxylase [Bacteroidales bacterium]
KMGYAIAEAFAIAGARVFLVSGPVDLHAPAQGVDLINVTSAGEMYDACKRLIDRIDVAIFNAAVSDFTPEEVSPKKVKRGTEDWNIKLKPTRDIAAEMGKTKKDGQLFIGFALETDNELEHARSKLDKKNLDLIVLNSLKEEGAGFGTDTNRVTMIGRSGTIDEYELKPKIQVAEDLVNRVVKMIDHA